MSQIVRLLQSLLPGSIGQKTGANSLAIVPASDYVFPTKPHINTATLTFADGATRSGFIDVRDFRAVEVVAGTVLASCTLTPVSASSAAGVNAATPSLFSTGAAVGGLAAFATGSPPSRGILDLSGISFLGFDSSVAQNADESDPENPVLASLNLWFKS